MDFLPSGPIHDLLNRLFLIVMMIITGEPDETVSLSTYESPASQASREGGKDRDDKGTQEKGKGREEKRRAERRREGKMAAQRGAVKARGQLHWISEHLRPYLLTANSRWNS